MSETGPRTREVTRTRPRTVAKRPPMFKVLLHNDHYTSMDFVVDVLKYIFHKAEAEAERIMLDVHQNGVGVAGVYAAEIAETKIDHVHKQAEKKGFPLKCSMEPE
jgi:ATP-dependent Clp protease adaptor protein ClpS